MERYKVLKDGKETEMSVVHDSFGTTPYYLVYFGKRLKGRFDSREEVMVYLRTFFLEREADAILGSR